jgi:hypothetical protein
LIITIIFGKEYYEAPHYVFFHHLIKFSVLVPSILLIIPTLLTNFSRSTMWKTKFYNHETKQNYTNLNTLKLLRFYEHSILNLVVASTIRN